MVTTSTLRRGRLGRYVAPTLGVPAAYAAIPALFGLILYIDGFPCHGWCALGPMLAAAVAAAVFVIASAAGTLSYALTERARWSRSRSLALSATCGLATVAAAASALALFATL